jgi:hypothetical protein
MGYKNEKKRSTNKLHIKQRLDTKIVFFSIDPGIYVLFSPGHIFGVCAKGAPEFTLGFYWGSCYSVFVLCVIANMFVCC